MFLHSVKSATGKCVVHTFLLLSICVPRALLWPVSSPQKGFLESLNLQGLSYTISHGAQSQVPGCQP